MSNLYNDINSTMTYMKRRGSTPEVIYVDGETYERLGKRSHVHGLPVVCDDGLSMRYRID